MLRRPSYPSVDALKCRRSRVLRELQFLRRLIRVVGEYEQTAQRLDHQADSQTNRSETGVRHA